MEESPSPALHARALSTAQYLQNALPTGLKRPRIAVICGSGLGGLADTINAEPRVEIPYAKIPNWAQSTVQGHEGKLVFGTIGAKKTPVMLLVGRAHFYEGHTMEMCTFSVRVIKLLAITEIIVTNAAGGLNQDYAVGDIVLLNDHLNLPGMVGVGPLRGPNDDNFGVRFPPLSDAYDLELRRSTHRAWANLGLGKGGRKLHEGVYAFLVGPTYETRAECRMLRMLGADVVGMSTVPEIVAARHCGIRVLAFSLVTNKSVLEAGPRGDAAEIQDLTSSELKEYLSRGMANHEEVLEAGRAAARDMQDLVQKIVEDVGSGAA